MCVCVCVCMCVCVCVYFSVIVVSCILTYFHLMTYLLNSAGHFWLCSGQQSRLTHLHERVRVSLGTSFQWPCATTKQKKKLSKLLFHPVEINIELPFCLGNS